MIYAFSVVWSFLLYGQNTINNLMVKDALKGFLSTIKWVLSVFDQSGTYNENLKTATNNARTIFDANAFQSVFAIDMTQVLPIILGTITTIIISWGTVKLITRILQLKVR